MIAAKFGRIVTISSLGVPLHLEGTSVYSATKSAVLEMTKILAKELAPVGITCNSVAPALIMTEAARAMGKVWAERLLAKQTIKRTATIEELGRVISFFVAPESSCVTGQVINMGLVS
jgi:3-oxoacyl-[acyl-carrier protein] reductase